MNPLAWLKARYLWRWIGTVEGPTHYVDDLGNRKPGGDRTCYWNLYERGDGKRDYKLIGVNHGSQAALAREAQVQAWYHGGPLPPLGRQVESAPKSKPKVKPEANVIAFPGGKEGA